MSLAVAVAVSACNSNAKNNQGNQTYTFKDSVKIIRDSLRLDSFERAEQARKDEAKRAEEIAAAKAAAREEVRNSYRSSSSVSSGSNTVASQPEKKGWSSAAKGAVIGAGAGAVTGILVDKKDGRGAAIGGVVGAGTGYIIGRQKDKQTGRAQ